ncbi:MAG: hypothetical protein Q8P41_17175 [Pseudomonadota bacterium]|nr:hypothetical protein [Pseudomonadota bacterium]
MIGTFAREQIVRSGAAPVLRGTVGDVPAILKRVTDGAPWHDPTSAFFGARGLVPPYVPALLHEAAAWARVAGDEVLGSGVDAAGPWLILRRHPGLAVERGAVDARALLAAGAAFLARLHAHDVLHRDLHPGNVLYDGAGFAFVDLDLALIRGVGAPGRVGKRRFRAPETRIGQEDARADLYSLGRTVEWCASAVSDDLRALLEALCAPDPSSRPSSANEVLAALGVEQDAPASLSPLHLGVAAWSRTRWADLFFRDPRRLVTLALSQELDRHALAAVAGRLLAAADSPEAWRALAALCAELGARTRERAYELQADEAQVRAASRCRALPSARNHDPLHGWRPDDPAAWALGVRALLAQGRAVHVAHALGAIGAAHGPRPYALATVEALNAGILEAAATFAALGQALFPDDAPLHVLRASVRLLVDDRGAGRAAVQALVVAHPGDAHAWLLLAALERLEGGDPTRALATAGALAPGGPSLTRLVPALLGATGD